MREQLQSLDKNFVLDVACGTGQSLAPLQRSGSMVFGVDACQEMLGQAARCTSLRGRLAVANAEQLPFPAGFASLVLCSMALSYFDNLAEVFEEFARVSAPGASVAVSDMHPEAQAAGWTRSFRAGKLQVELDHHRRSWEEIERTAEHAGLEACACTSVFFGEQERPIFERADKAALFATIQKKPALCLAIWKKPW
jgi:ubiquinone/menaquinone biosynthesis C-methylase UbiE